MNPGKTNFPVASITSAPAGADKSLPIRLMVSPSHHRSARYRASAVTISPFLMSSGMSWSSSREFVRHVVVYSNATQFERQFGEQSLGRTSVRRRERFAERNFPMEFPHDAAV